MVRNFLQHYLPPQQGLVWWDADPLRELHTYARGGAGPARPGTDLATGGPNFRSSTVSKWKGPVLTEGIEGRHVL